MLKLSDDASMYDFFVEAGSAIQYAPSCLQDYTLYLFHCLLNFLSY